MKTFGEYIRKARENKGLPLRKVAAALDIDTSILSKIERNERRATIEMIPTFANSLDKIEKEVELQFIQSAIITDLGKLKYLKDGLKEILKTL
jgi:transcriptional regulator with XRE-family HTH domain